MQLQVPQLSLIDQRGVDAINNFSFMYNNETQSNKKALNLQELKLDFPPKIYQGNQKIQNSQLRASNGQYFQQKNIQQPFPKSMVDSQAIQYGKLADQRINSFTQSKYKQQQSKLSLVDIDAMYSDNYAIKQEIKDLRQQNNDIITQIAQQKSRLLNLNNEKRKDIYELNKEIRKSDLKLSVQKMKQGLQLQQEQAREEERNQIQQLIEKHKNDKIIEAEKRQQIKDDKEKKNQIRIEQRKSEMSALQALKDELDRQSFEKARENAKTIKESLTHTFQDFHANRRNMIRNQIASDLISQKESIVKEIEFNQSTLDKLKKEVEQLEKEVMDNKIAVQNKKKNLH